MFYEVLMEKKAMMGALKRGLAYAGTSAATNPYAVTGALAGGVGGAVAAGEGNRLKGALGGAAIGGLAGKGLQAGIARFDKGELGQRARTLQDIRKDVYERIPGEINKGTKLKDLSGLKDLAKEVYGGKESIGGPMMLGTAAATGGIAGGAAMRFAKEDAERQRRNPRPRKGNPFLGLGGYAMGMKR
jgi:hypothetical protein